MELPAGMASLQIEENKLEGGATSATEESDQEPTNRRVMRKRYSSPIAETAMKRQRTHHKMQERLNTEKEIRDYYIKVNKNWSVKQTNLETIFEEPKESNGSVVTMSGAKVRRAIMFSGRLTKAKKLKRSAKTKRLQLTLTKSEKKRKLSLAEVKLRLSLLESSVDEVVSSDL